MRYLLQTRLLNLETFTRSTITSYILRRGYHSNTTVDFGEGQSSNNGTISDWQHHLESTVISDPRTVSICFNLSWDINSMFYIDSRTLE
jgi:hypothetical protein